MSSDQTLIKPWHGIPREEIAWHPTIVPDRCTGCGLCVTSCGRKVYGFDYDQNKPVVVNPLQCMVGCSTCATLCPRGAIEFPSHGYIQQVIREGRVARHSKDMLRQNQALYSVSPSNSDKVEDHS